MVNDLEPYGLSMIFLVGGFSPYPSEKYARQLDDYSQLNGKS